MKKILNTWVAAFVMILVLGFFSARPAEAADGYLEVTEVTSNSATLNWDKPAYSIEGATVKVLGYKVYYGTSPSKLSQYGKSLKDSVTTKKITGLKTKKKYYFQVKVVIKTTNKTTKKSAKDVTDYLESPVSTVTLPGKIENLRATDNDPLEETMTFKWKDVNPNYNVFGYQYYVKSAAGKKLSSGRKLTNGVKLKNVSSDTYYLGKVRSFIKLETRDGKKYCYGEWSDWVVLMADPIIYSAKMDNGKLNVTWTGIDGVDGYYVYVFKDGWKKVYKATLKMTSDNSATILKLNGKSFVPSGPATYEVGVVAYKKLGDKTYRSRGNNYIPIAFN